SACATAVPSANEASVPSTMNRITDVSIQTATIVLRERLRSQAHSPSRRRQREHARRVSPVTLLRVACRYHFSMPRRSTILRLLIAMAIGAAVLGAAAAHAATSTVTFDDQTNGTLIGSQYAASNGVTFMDPPSDTVRVTDAPGFAHSGNEVAAVERTCMCE